MALADRVDRATQVCNGLGKQGISARRKAGTEPSAIVRRDVDGPQHCIPELPILIADGGIFEFVHLRQH